MNVKEYIEQHDFIDYCEAIIFPNGDIIDATYGHTNTLIKAIKLPREVINIIMPVEASPILWLTGFTKCIPLYYDYFIYDSITQEQLNTLQELVNNGILKNNIIGHRTDEYYRCDLLNKFAKGEISIDDIPKRIKETIVISDKR